MSLVDIGAELFYSFYSVNLIELCTANQIEINDYIVTKRISPYRIACVIRDQTIHSSFITTDEQLQ